MLAGWLVALVGLVLVLGPPLAAVPKTGMLPFAVKTGFALTFAAASVFAAMAAGRPGPEACIEAGAHCRAVCCSSRTSNTGAERDAQQIPGRTCSWVRRTRDA